MDWCDFRPLRIYHFYDIQYHFPDQLVLNPCQTICLTEDSSFQKNNHGNCDFLNLHGAMQINTRCLLTFAFLLE